LQRSIASVLWERGRAYFASVVYFPHMEPALRALFLASGFGALQSQGFQPPVGKNRDRCSMVAKKVGLESRPTKKYF
jgi:hypothetical protein